MFEFRIARDNDANIVCAKFVVGIGLSRDPLIFYSECLVCIVVEEKFVARWDVDLRVETEMIITSAVHAARITVLHRDVVVQEATLRCARKRSQI